MSVKSASAPGLGRCYVFREFELDMARESISRNGEELRLRPKSFSVLSYLVQHPGRLVTKEELLSAIWGHLHVTEGSLTQCLIDIRRVLADSAHEIVRTVPRRGYIFEPEVAIKRSDTARRKRWAVLGAVAGILLAVLAALWNNLLTDTGESLWQPDPVALEHYRRGEFFWQRRASGDSELAGREFRRAVAVDPDYAAAWVALAGVLNERFYTDGAASPSRDQLGYLHRVLQRALQADPDLVEAHVRMAGYYLTVGNESGYERHWMRAQALGPDNFLVLSRGAGFAARQGHYQNAVELQRRAVELDPLSAVAHLNFAAYLMADGQFKEAEAQLRETMELNPSIQSREDDFASPVGTLAMSLLLQHRYRDALALATRPGAREVDRDLVMAMAYWALGMKAEYGQVLRRMSGEVGLRRQMHMAELSAFQGDSEGAFDRLSKILSHLKHGKESPADTNLTREICLSPLFIPLRDDPRWLRQGMQSRQG
ncbi:MAG: winged helix-turn-helix domain-containing protein [Pseudomonadales bacterium]|nr:winged helix-turn-helix domain-containing protein [Pseudomonadales bacterium]